MNWSYKSSTKRSSGYEPVINELKGINKELYLSLGEDDKEELVNTILSIYREAVSYTHLTLPTICSV